MLNCVNLLKASEEDVPTDALLTIPLNITLGKERKEKGRSDCDDEGPM